MKFACSLCIWLTFTTILAMAQNNPVPFLNQPVLPTTVAPGGPGFTLTVNGSGFVSGATVNWNGSPRPTIVLSTTQATATIPASDIASPSTAIITVTNPAPGGGISNDVYLSVTDPIAEVALARTDVALGPLTPIGGIGATFVVPGNLVAADFNGDGKLDLVVGEGGGGIILGGTVGGSSACVQLGLDNGNFQAPGCYSVSRTYTSQGTAFPFLVVIADVNGDGKLDLVCTAADPYFPNIITVFLGKGDGTFQTTPQTTTYASSAFLEAVAGVGDFNRDGKLDLVAVDSGATTLLAGNGDGTFAAPSVISTTTPNATIGDFNRDGKLDVVIADATTSQLQIFLGNGDGTFQAPQTISTLVGPVAAADVNADGNLDLILQTAAPSSALLVFQGNGDGTFQLPQSTVDSNASFITPVLGDLNGDGKLDFLNFLTEQTGDVLSLQFGNSNGTFQAPVTFSALDLPANPALAIGDLNSDGRMDVAGFTVNNTNNTLNFSTFIQGVFAVANIVPGILSFAEEPIGQSSSQPVMLTNTGNTLLTISSIGFAGANAADFSQTNNCGTAVAANASCTINVTFTSKGGGSLTASLSITDNASGSPQTVPITATSPDFSMTANTSPSATISPGQTATYGITVASVQNFVGTVTLSCSGGPPGSTCTVSPGSVSVESPATATVTVSTPAPGSGTTTSLSFPHFNSWESASMGLFAITLLILIRKAAQPWQPQLRRVCLRTLLILGTGVAISSCGGGGGGGGSAGTYTVNASGTYTANSVTVTHNTKLTLIVK